jgi:hypothetical protein
VQVQLFSGHCQIIDWDLQPVWLRTPHQITADNEDIERGVDKDIEQAYEQV